MLIDRAGGNSGRAVTLADCHGPVVSGRFNTRMAPRPDFASVPMTRGVVRVPAWHVSLSAGNALLDKQHLLMQRAPAASVDKPDPHGCTPRLREILAVGTRHCAAEKLQLRVNGHAWGEQDAEEHEAGRNRLAATRAARDRVLFASTACTAAANMAACLHGRQGPPGRGGPADQYDEPVNPPTLQDLDRDFERVPSQCVGIGEPEVDFPLEHQNGIGKHVGVRIVRTLRAPS